MIPNHGPALAFGLGEAADAIRDTTARFCADRIAPRAAQIDADNTFPRDLWTPMGELGLHGITVEEDYGGLGLGYLEHVVAMEEVSRASASVGLSYGAHSNLCVNQLRRWGTDAQKRLYLPQLISGDNNWGSEPVMQRCEQEGLAYLFRLRRTANVKRALDHAMLQGEWLAAGHGWQGKETRLRLTGWGRERRVILLRRRLKGPIEVTGHRGDASKQLSLGFVDVQDGAELWEVGALVTSLSNELVSLGQLYRDRGDCENAYDELKNQWGWGGFTTHDLARCELMTRMVALTYNWWSMFARLADPDRHQEAITSRPLLMHAVARRTEHAGQTTLTITSIHGQHERVQTAYRRIAAFFATLRSTAEQLAPLERWYRILSQVMKKYLKGRLLRAPPLLRPA